MICKVDPNNIFILRNVAGVFLLCAFISIACGKTYCKRTITRIEEPVSYWGTVIVYFLLGTMMLLGTYVCQQGQVKPCPRLNSTSGTELSSTTR